MARNTDIYNIHTYIHACLFSVDGQDPMTIGVEYTNTQNNNINSNMGSYHFVYFLCQAPS